MQSYAFICCIFADELIIMLFSMKYLKSFPLTLACVALIWFLCFCTPPSTSLDEVPFIDKWVHMAMYGGTMSVFWLEYWRFEAANKKWSERMLLALAVVFPILMSGLIELLQAYCTGGRRSGDWMDFLANSCGVLLGLVIGLTAMRHLVQWLSHRKD